MSSPSHRFRLYNTLSRAIEDFEPLVPGKIGIYVCGMTVYDRAHVGHARAMVVFDTFVRYLRHRGWDVDFVRNFTDVDDKIIARASERGEDPAALAERYVQAFRDDVAALGLAPPDREPRVTGSIDEIVALIGELVARGHAYAAEGSVWFSVETFAAYGKLSHQDPGELRSADAADGKRAPADFALWKAAKPGEPQWPSPFGPGRPGWHIECSAMSRTHLGRTFDIHGGGLDLVFPHHENEVAQSEAAHGCDYARYWMHNGLLTMSSGQKMGKSLGNVIDVVDVLETFPAEAVRLYYLQNHYRSPLPWNDEALPEALAMLARLYEAKETLATLGGPAVDPDALARELGVDAVAVVDLARALPERIETALDDDFNTAQALGHAFELARAINRFANAGVAKKRGAPIAAVAGAALDQLGRALNLLGAEPHAFFEEVKDKRLPALGLDRASVDARLRERDDLRRAKDFARADAIRKQLDDAGIVVMDGPEGARWRVRIAAA